MNDGRVRVIGPQPSGFAEMLGAMVEGNLQRHPERSSLLHGPAGVIRITAVDAGVAVSLEFRDGTLRLYSGAAGPADVEIEADSETLVGFSAVPQRGPLPDPLTAGGRAAIKKAFRGDIKVRGAVRGSRLLKRMRGLLAIDAD